jgi:uroporphyrinogen-III decarboxylase
MLQEEFDAISKGSATATAAEAVGPVFGSMTPRERFARCMHFQSVDRVPHMEFGFWDETRVRWHKQGLPAQYDSHETIETYFGCMHTVHAPMTMATMNSRPEVIVETRENSVVKRDGLGTLFEQIRHGAGTIPHYLEFPVKDRASWAAFRDEFLPLDFEERVPADIARTGAALLRSDRPVAVSLGSYLGYVRNWIGFENIALMFYDDPELIEEIIAHLSTIYQGVLGRVLPHVSADLACGWEDICFNSGPICSPDMFRSIVIPHLKPVLRLLRQHGVDVIWTDCDGDIRPLVPLWLEAGLNCMFPLEVHGGSDPVEIRKKYGHEVLLVGGFDKMALLKGKKAILAELKRLEPTVADGGFIPHVDHRCPPDVSLDNYKYYREQKQKLIGKL